VKLGITMASIQNVAESINQKSFRVRLGILIGIIVVICGFYWYFFWSPKSDELNSARAELQKEEKKLNEYQAIARELPRFEQEFNKLNKEFEASARKLPEEKEIPSLIDGIYKEVSGSGLESNTFAPKGEVKKNIYAEIPIEMEVYGSYYDLANFFDRISRLPRIVNIRDLNLSREKKKERGDSTLLTADFTTVTFRLLPPGSTQPETDTKGKKSAKPKRSSEEN
jgi:type IV pilus assembly protein PilO